MNRSTDQFIAEEEMNDHTHKCYEAPRLRALDRAGNLGWRMLEGGRPAPPLAAEPHSPWNPRPVPEAIQCIRVWEVDFIDLPEPSGDFGVQRAVVVAAGTFVLALQAVSALIEDERVQVLQLEKAVLAAADRMRLMPSELRLREAEHCRALEARLDRWGVRCTSKLVLVGVERLKVLASPS